MPLYEYFCTRCEHDFEGMAKLDEPNPPCPECAGATEKHVTGGAIVKKLGTKAGKKATEHAAKRSAERAADQTKAKGR